MCGLTKYIYTFRLHYLLHFCCWLKIYLRTTNHLRFQLLDIFVGISVLYWKIKLIILRTIFFFEALFRSHCLKTRWTSGCTNDVGFSLGWFYFVHVSASVMLFHAVILLVYKIKWFLNFWKFSTNLFCYR